MKVYKFSDLDAQAKALAVSVGDDIKAILEKKPHVVVCVPGGQTPKLFFAALFAQNLQWSRVILVLTDERWVPFDNDKSNERQLVESIAGSDAMLSRRVSFYHGGRAIDVQVVELTTQMQDLSFIDICVLGMGEDGHIASLFPDMPNLDTALDKQAQPAVIVARPTYLSESRVSFNLAALLSASHHYLLVTGPSKLNLLEAHQSQAKPSVPIDHLLNETHVDIYYTA